MTNTVPRHTRRAGAAFLAALTLVVLLATPASAHASLLESQPSSGAVLQSAPEQIVLSFTEPVDASFGAIRIYDADGDRISTGDVVTKSNVVSLPLPDLEDGSFAVTYRVTSADAHPVSGAFTFQIGNAGNASSPRAQALAQSLLDNEKGEQIVGAVYGVSRWLLFAGIALMIGCAAFGVMIWQSARAARVNRKLVWGGWLATTVGTALGVLVYGPYAAGVGLGDMFNSTLLDQTLDSRYGQMGVARLVLLALGVPILLMLLARDGDEPRALPKPWLGAAGLFAVLISATPGLAGHASSGDLVELAVVTDTIHVLAMAMWLGGLVTLAAVVLRKSMKVQTITEPVQRWSRLAFGCVAAIVVTGTFQAVRQVGSLTALRSTEYGRMLIIKLLLFAGLLLLAAFSRESVRYLFPQKKPAGAGKTKKGVPVVAGGADDDAPKLTKAERAEYERTELGRLRRSVLTEVLVAIAVLVVTALLVNAPPAKSAEELARGNAQAVTLTARDVEVQVAVVPAKRGKNAVHVSVLNRKGDLKDVEDLTITFAFPEEDIEDLEVPLENISAGHYTTSELTIPISGTWQITAKVVVSEFTQRTITAEIEIDDR